jgi:hypothetical protein
MTIQRLPRITKNTRDEFARQIEEAIREDGDRVPLLLAYTKILEEENPVLLERMKEVSRTHFDSGAVLFELIMLYALLHFHIEDEPHVLH